MASGNRRRRGKRSGERSPSDSLRGTVTPLIDVTFLVLIFLLTTGKFQTLKGKLDTFLPRDR